jgi:hypothetical protein
MIRPLLAAAVLLTGAALMAHPTPVPAIHDDDNTTQRGLRWDEIDPGVICTPCGCSSVRPTMTHVYVYRQGVDPEPVLGQHPTYSLESWHGNPCDGECERLEFWGVPRLTTYPHKFMDYPAGTMVCVRLTYSHPERGESQCFSNEVCYPWPDYILIGF